MKNPIDQGTELTLRFELHVKEEQVKQIADYLLRNLDRRFRDTKLANQSIEPVSTDNPARLAFTMRETAVILGVSYESVYRLVKRGLLKPSLALRKVIIAKKEIERFLEETTSDI